MVPAAPQRMVDGGFGRSTFSDVGLAEATEVGSAGQFDHTFAAAAPASALRLAEPDGAEEQAANQMASGAVDAMASRDVGIEARGSTSAPSENRVDAPVARARGAAPGTPLDPAQRDELEPVVGQSLADVRMHTDEAADAESRALGARAFTRGRDVHFQRGLFQPHTSAGRWLLTHELTHAIRSRTNVVARNGVGTPMGAATNLRPSTPAEDREFVALAIEFMQRGKEHYDPAVAGIGGTPRAPILRTPPVTRDQLVRQLDGWKATTTQCLVLIQSSLGNDAALDQQVHQTYRVAVESAVTAAATHQGRSRHEIFDEHHDRIHDFAWPPATANADRNALSDALSVQERSQIRSVTTSINLGSIDSFFAANAQPVQLPPNTTVRFNQSVGRALQTGLQNVAASLAGMANSLELNSTLTFGLDLGRVGGDYAAYRFTRVHHAAQRGQPANDEILVEQLGMIGLERARPGDVKRQSERFARLGLSLGSGWQSTDFETDAELQALLRGLDGVPDSALTRVPGLTFNRASASTAHPDWAGEYSFGSHAITLFNSAFPTSLTRFGTPGAGLSDTTSFTVRHEIGHALDQIALRTAMSDWNASVNRLNAQVDRQHTEFGDVETSPNRFQIPADRRASWEALQRDITAARTREQAQVRARDAARSLSGARLQRQAGGNVFESVQGPTAAGTIAFRQAATTDGVRITHYSDESWLEYFAETYAMFVSAPDDLRRLKPNVFAFMQATFP